MINRLQQYMGLLSPLDHKMQQMKVQLWSQMLYDKQKKKSYRKQKKQELHICSLHMLIDALPSSLLDPSWVQVSQTTELFKTWGTPLALKG